MVRYIMPTNITNIYRKKLRLYYVIIENNCIGIDKCFSFVEAVQL